MLGFYEGELWVVDTQGCFDKFPAESKYAVIGCAEEVVRGYLGTSPSQDAKVFRNAVTRAHEVMPGVVGSVLQSWFEVIEVTEGVDYPKNQLPLPF
jgi:flavin-binding protein dodecin